MEAQEGENVGTVPLILKFGTRSGRVVNIKAAATILTPEENASDTH